MVTEKHLYHISMNISLILQIALKDIQGITVIKTSSSVFVLHLKSGFEVLMETIRRTELIIFIISMFDKEGLPRPNLI